MSTGSAEAALWKLMRKNKLPGKWVRIEGVESGAPDLCYCFPWERSVVTGWLELKSVMVPDKKDRISISHYTKEQVLWAQEWRKAGGFVGLLVRVLRPRPIYFLLGSFMAAELEDGKAQTLDWFRCYSLITFGPSFDKNKLCKGLWEGSC
jgi:hypothetical protein